MPMYNSFEPLTMEFCELHDVVSHCISVKSVHIVHGTVSNSLLHLLLASLQNSLKKLEK
jgi:hypothetical protein